MKCPRCNETIDDGNVICPACRAPLKHLNLTPLVRPAAIPPAIARKYPAGTKLKRKVSKLLTYGAQVQLEEGVFGLIHLAEMSWTLKISNPAQMLKVGDEVEAMVLRADTQIALSIKQARVDPWIEEIPGRFKPSDVVEGKVTRLASFGAYIEIAPDLEALLPIAEMTGKISTPGDLVRVGQVLRLKIHVVDVAERKIDLSLRAMTPAPAPVLPPAMPPVVNIPLANPPPLNPPPSMPSPVKPALPTRQLMPAPEPPRAPAPISPAPQPGPAAPAPIPPPPEATPVHALPGLEVMLTQRTLVEQRRFTPYNADLTAAYKAMRAERFDEALQAFEAVLRIDASLVAGRNGKAAALIMLNRITEALQVIDGALASHPRAHELWANKGTSLCRLQQYKLALEAYDTSVDVGNYFPQVWAGKATAFRALGMDREANACFDEAERARVHGGRVLFIYHNGTAAEASGRLDVARKAYQDFLNANPTPAMAAQVEKARKRLMELGTAEPAPAQKRFGKEAGAAAQPKNRSIKEDIAAASMWISMALRGTKYEADFSPRSLREIDRFFDEHSRNGVAKPGGRLEEKSGYRLFALGAYVGEVLRKAKGGEWHGDDSDPAVEVNVELRFPDGTICLPMQRVIKRFRLGSAEGIAAYGIGLGLKL